MPEIAGAAAAIADPFNPADIAEKMAALTTDTGYRNRLVALGFVQSARFSWRSMARSVLDIYKEIGASTGTNDKR